MLTAVEEQSNRIGTVYKRKQSDLAASSPTKSSDSTATTATAASGTSIHALLLL